MKVLRRTERYIIYPPDLKSASVLLHEEHLCEDDEAEDGEKDDDDEEAEPLALGAHLGQAAAAELQPPSGRAQSHLEGAIYSS